MTPLFVTGMFRSGTTLVARALNTHPDIAVASDPFLEFFKCVRSDLAREVGHPTPYTAPLSDYYFSDVNLSLLRAIESASLDRPWSDVDWNDFMRVITARCEAYSARLVPYLVNLSGNTYRDILASMLQQIGSCYGGENPPAIVGLKEVWATEFVPLFLHELPSAKAILIQRDPRAVGASKNKTPKKYPWLFLTKQWRKLAALAWAYSHRSGMKDRIYLLSFERLILSPQQVTREICEFLEISWHPDLVDPRKYQDGAGSPWRQNTSYGAGVIGFNADAVDKWREVLAEDEIAFIEFICGPEMALFGYQPSRNGRTSCDHRRKEVPVIDDKEQANWVKTVIANESLSTTGQIELEYERDRLLRAVEKPHRSNVEQAFLHAIVYEAVRRTAAFA